MKNLLTFALTALLVLPLCAQDEGADAGKTAKNAEMEALGRQEVNVWPAFVAVSQWPRTSDVVGLRLTIPFSTEQENVTGLDLGLWGKSLYFDGIQVNVLRNNVTDGGSGIQVGLYNSMGSADLFAVQVGLWNESRSLGGVQAGLVNVVGEARGFQVGLVNRAETLTGYQVGLINVIRDAELRFCPIVNIGF